MRDDGRLDRESILLAILIGVFTALVILLLVVLLVGSDGDGSQAATTAAPATTSAATGTAASTTSPPSTAATTTAAPATTTSTTSAPTTTTTIPFVGSTDWQGCGASSSDAGMVSAVRVAQREGFTRVVFDFTAGIPSCSVGYSDPHTLAVIVYPIDIANPYATGIFDGSGQLQVGTNSVNRVGSGGMGGGSGEWEFSIDLAGTRDFSVFTLADPSRLAIDIED